MIITKPVYAFCLTLLLLSCNHSTDNTAASTKPKDISGSQALYLAKKSGCLACHSVEKKIVGPAWRDISNRYLNDTNANLQLTEKIKKGGKGNWTDITGGAPMPPYSPRVSDTDINNLVSFILGIAGNNVFGKDPVNLAVNTAPITVNLAQDQHADLYFTTSAFGSNFLYKIEIIMVNGIVDMSVEYPDSQGNLLIVNNTTGVDGQTSIEFYPNERSYDLVINARTDAIFTLSVTTSESSFMLLAKQSGCFACHSIQNKIVGPSWQDVSTRYRGSIEAEAMLIDKVKQGGSGNWTDITGAAPMPPYSPRVSDENITLLVQEILKLE